jgi:hypothetical protein
VGWDLANNKVEDDEIAENDEVVAILLTQGDRSETRWYGLVLKRVGGESDLYKRIGAFSCDQKDGEYFLGGTRRVVLI